MKLELEVLASTSIKRKKPWPRMAFIGEVNESLCMIDSPGRVSILYVPSGKTKKKVNKLDKLLPQVLSLTYSDNGHFLGGLLNTGEFFLWHKDSDILKFTAPLAAIIEGALMQSAESLNENSGRNENLGKNEHVKDKNKSSGSIYSSIYICVAGDGQSVLVVLNHTQVFLWQMAEGEKFFGSKQSHIYGCWTQVGLEAEAMWPREENRETAAHAAFYLSEFATGLNCKYSMVFNNETSMCVSSLHLRWLPKKEIYSYDHPTYLAKWQSLHHPLSSLTSHGSPINARGAYVCARSHDGQLLAIAVNQHNTHTNKIVFVANSVETMVVADLKGCGAKNPVIRYSKSYWVCDMQWTADDLFVACMLQQGSLCMVTRLGEPLLLQTYGCSIEMGPKLFLPLHPVIVVKPQAEDDSERSGDPVPLDTSDPLRQRFSVTAHPRLPVLVCSDGYMVTVVQLPGDTTCLSIMKGLVLESNHYLHQIRESEKVQLSLYDTIKRQNNMIRVANKKYLAAQERMGLAAGKSIMKTKRYGPPTVGYRFELPPEDEDILNGTLDQETAQRFSEPAITNMSAGKISFGDVDNLNTTLDYRSMVRNEGLSVAQNINMAQKSLILAWSLGASHVGLWTADHETVALNVVDNMVKLFTALLHTSSQVFKEYTSISGNKRKVHDEGGSRKTNRKLIKVLHLFRIMLQILHLDHNYKHMQVVAMHLAQSTCRMLLTNKDLELCESRRRTFHGAFVLLKYCEMSLQVIYTDLPREPLRVSVNGQHIFGYDLYEPAGCVQLINQHPVNEDENVQNREIQYDEFGEEIERSSCDAVHSTSPPGCDFSHYKRLGVTWQLLYKYIMVHYRELQAQAKSQRKAERAATRMEARWILEMGVLVESKLQAMDMPIPFKRSLRIYPGEKFSLDGSEPQAIQSWVQHLDLLTDEKLSGRHGCRLLLAILYTLLQQYELRAVLDLTEFLIRRADVRKGAALCRHDAQTRKSLLSLLVEMPDNQKRRPPIAYIHCKSVRTVVQSIARLMSAYFTNKTLFVFPPHCPKKLPPLHVDYKIEQRVLPLQRDQLASAIRQEGLDNLWVVERAMEYHLLCGGVTEAAWLANSLGDWKTAFLIGVAVVKHEKKNRALYKRKPKLQLPQELKPLHLLESKLEHVFNPKDAADSAGLVIDEATAPQLERAVSDLLLASTLARLSLLPALLAGLTRRLHRLVRAGLAPLVPDALYLPAPPVYCPQPAPDNSADAQSDAALRFELGRRQELSTVLQLIQLVLRASHTTLPAARWYVNKVVEAFAKGLKYKKDLQTDEVEVDIAVLQDAYLSLPSIFNDNEDSPTIQALLHCFREMCTVLWMMFARDKLSLALREKSKLALARFEKKQSVNEDTWQDCCNNALTWTFHMMPFAKCLEEGELTLGSLLIAIIIELPQTEESANLLAEYFHDHDNLHPDLQEKIDQIVKGWRGVFLNEEQSRRKAKKSSKLPGSSPRGFTLSLYYEKAVQRMEKTLRRKSKTFKTYSQYIYEGDKAAEDLMVGSRPMESEEAYLKFLDLVFAICFNKVVDEEKDQQNGPPKPLLPEYGEDIVKQELNSLVHQSITSLEKRDSMNKLNFHHTPAFRSGQRVQSPSRLSRQHAAQLQPHSDRTVHVKSIPPASPRSKVGLFRSRSLTELRNKNRNANSRGVSPVRTSKSTPKSKVPFLDLSYMEATSSLQVPSPRGNQRRSRSADGRPTSKDRELRVEDLTSSQSLRRYYINTEHSENQSPSKVSHFGELDDSIDPLTVPILQPWILESMDFGSKYMHLEQLLEWLGRWAGRNHSLGAAVDAKLSTTNAKPAMRIRVPPRVIIYALWQIEQKYPEVKPEQRDSATTMESRLDEDVEAPVAVTIETQTEDDVTITGLDEEESISIKALPDDYVLPAEPKKRRKKKRKKHRDSDSEEAIIVKEISETKPIIARQSEEQIVESHSSRTGYITEEEVDEITEEEAVKIPPVRSKRREQKRDGGKARDASSSRKLDELDLNALIDDELRHSMQDTLSKLRRSLEEKYVKVKQQSANSTMTMQPSLHVEDLIDDQRQQDHAPSVASTAEDAVSLNTTLPFTDREPPLTARSTGRSVDTTGTRTATTTRDTVREVVRKQQVENGGGLMADELRSIVRTELRKIMEAQHQGILSMLGALGPDPVQSTAHTGKRGVDDRTVYEKNQPVECVVMSAQVEHQNPAISSTREHGGHMDNSLTQVTSYHGEKSSTDIEVTPIPSDADDDSFGKPLTMSQLSKEPPWSKAHAVPIHGALRELRHLESDQETKKGHRVTIKEDNKENQRPHLPIFHPPPVSHQPFSRLMGVLSQINSNLAGSQQMQQGPPNFLRIPPERDVPGAGYFAHPPNQHQSSVPHMPLLRPDNCYIPSRVTGGLHHFQVPERDTNHLPAVPQQTGAPPPGHQAPQGPVPFPLLSLHSHLHYCEIENRQGIPKLVPPEELLAYEQKKYKQTQVVKDMVQAQMEARPGARLLKADFEPFAPVDERDKKTRSKRREKKKAGKKKKKTDSKETDSESITTQESTEVSPKASKDLRKSKDQATLTDRDVHQPEKLVLENSGVQTEETEVAVEKVDAAVSVRGTPRDSPRKDRGRSEKKNKDSPRKSQSQEILEDKIYDGYAITPGLYDSYLGKDVEYGTAMDNNARVQHHAATSIKQSPRRKKGGEPEESSAIPQEMREALEKYYKSRDQPGTVLPPDIFLGLRFADPNQKPEDVTQPGSGRAFLNVVDIGADVLDDIGAPKRKPVKKKEKTSPRQLRSKIEQEEESEEEEKDEKLGTRRGPDALTVDLLGKKSSSDGSQDGVVTKAARLKSRESIRKRLESMDQQFNALNSMAQNMEDDFKSSKLLLHTIDRLGEALAPDLETYPRSRVVERHLTPANEKDDDDQSDGAASTGREGQKSDRQRRQDKAQEDAYEEDFEEDEAPKRSLELSGLSGVEDIVGEYLATGDIVAETVGLTEEQAEDLAEKAATYRARHGGSPRQKALNAYTQRSDEKKSEEEKEKLRKWMEDKQKERQKEYVQTRKKLAEQEFHPFKAQNELLRTGEINELNKTKNEERKRRQEIDEMKRAEEAKQLLRDMLTDKPELPPKIPVSARSAREKPTLRDRSASPHKTSTYRGDSAPARRVPPVSPIRVRTRTPSPAPKRTVYQREMSPMSRFEADDLDRMEVDHEYCMMYDEHKWAGRVHPHRSDFSPQRPATSYHPHHEQPGTDMQQRPQSAKARPQPSKQPPQKHKEKKLHEMVRMQQPEKTRGRARRTPMNYTERLSQLGNSGTSARTATPSSVKSQQKLYGSTRLPGQQKTRRGPRVVKTYTERLQDMKATPGSYTQISQPYPGPGDSLDESASSRGSRQRDLEQRGLPLPRQTYTYQQQLRALQPPKELYRSIDSNDSGMRATALRSRKPPHESTTYGERLRELQQAPTVSPRRLAYGHREPAIYRTPPVRSALRSRPYGDPYNEIDDSASVVSRWSVDENVKNIIYGDDASYAEASAATEADMDNMSELDYLRGEGYTSMVDVGDLHELGSVSSGSIMSFIDWDQVDQLIQEVR